MKKKCTLLPISLRNIHLSFYHSLVIDNLSLDLNSDGITIIMGFNGAGKSTLLKLLSNLLTPDSGTITWAGNAVLSKSLKLAQTIVLQKPVMLRRSVRENLKFVLKKREGSDNKGVNSIDKKIMSLLELVNLENLADRSARSLSLGEQQRLSVIRSLALNPSIVYFDEPTSGLDPLSTKIIEDVIRQGGETGIKMVVVTHSVSQAKRLGDDIIFMHNGKVIEQESANAFFNSPKSKEAKSFLSGVEVGD